MPDETNIQDDSIGVDQAVASDTSVTEVDVPTDAATDTPVSVTDTPADDASSTPVSAPVDTPAPVEADPVPVEAPVAAPPVVEPAPPVIQPTPAPAPDKFSQNQTLWQQLLERARARQKQRQFNNIAKTYQYILKRKQTTVRDIQLLLLCRKRAAENYLDALIKQNQIKRVGETNSSKVYYQSVAS